MYIPSLKEFIKNLLGDISLDITLSIEVWKQIFEKIEGLLDQLSPREQQVISYRFDLRGEGKMTLGELGSKLGVSGERIRQIQAESLKKLRYYVNQDIELEVILGFKKVQTVSLCAFQEIVGAFWPPVPLIREELLSKPISDLGLSVRSSICLENANINTVRELVQKSENEMLKYRNFGRKSLHELKDVLNEMGLTFGMNIDNSIERR